MPVGLSVLIPFIFIMKEKHKEMSLVLSSLDQVFISLVIVMES